MLVSFKRVMLEDYSFKYKIKYLCKYPGIEIHTGSNMNGTVYMTTIKAIQFYRYGGGVI